MPSPESPLSERAGSSDLRLPISWALLPIRIRTAAKLSDDALLELCRANRDLKIERSAEGEILVMSPTGGETGNRNIKVLSRLNVWAEADGTGVAFDSSTGFLLPNGAERSPDGAWIRLHRWAALAPEARRGLVPLCPDFVIELRSPSDDLGDQQAKMDEYQRCGASLGWLFDFATRRVWIYRPGHPPEVLDDPDELRGDPVLPAFVLDLANIR